LDLSGYPTRHSSTPSSAATILPTEPTGVRSMSDSNRLKLEVGKFLDTVRAA
jgi:hypothetical protein